MKFERIRVCAALAPYPVQRLVLTALVATTPLGCIDDGPAIEAKPQSITFSTAPSPALGQVSATASATASSGLPVRYSGLTPGVCSVDMASGQVTAATSGTCTIAADQGGNDEFAAAQRVTQDILFSFGQSLVFAEAPKMRRYDRATVRAVDGAGRSVTYATTTPAVCSVETSTGAVTAISTGVCAIVADSGKLQATQQFVVDAPSETTAPGRPTGATASAGNSPNSVSIRVAAISSGGRPILGYSVQSNPPGITRSSDVLPVEIVCPSSCAGLAFSVSATNAIGTGPSSELADIITSYDVLATFHEPDTQPNDTIFRGSFTFDATTTTVASLRGRLSESMTGGVTGYPNDTMTWLSLEHPLSAVPISLDGANGLLVTTFLLATTHTLSDSPALGGTDGWSPGTGMGLYYGYPNNNPGNAYARIFVNSADPTAPLTQAQLDKLAYADCTPGGLMGATCMTGTTALGYGQVGTMSGYPVSQVVTKH